MLSAHLTAAHPPSIQNDSEMSGSSSSRSPANICIISGDNQIADDENQNYTTLPSNASTSDSVVSELMSLQSSSQTTEITTPPDVDHGHDDDVDHLKGLSVAASSTAPAFRPASLLPSLSLLYPDTAPRSAWRPQVNSWLKKNQPSKLREIAELFADFRSKDNDAHHSIIQHHHNQHNSSNNNHNNNYMSNLGHIKTFASPVSSRKERRYSHEKPYSRNIKPQESYPSSCNHFEPPSPPLSPPTNDHSSRRKCISCGSDQSPCWRPSWSATAGQLCNSCGLRYKKTGARCLSRECLKIPAKGEWMMMKNAAFVVGDKLIYTCLSCGGEVEVGERG